MKKRNIAKTALAVLSVMTIGAAGASLAACDKDGEHTHSYGKWTLITDPTLTAGGKAERYCKDNDGGKEEKDVPVLTDTSVWTENLTVKVDPTCSAEGKREFTSADYGTVTVTLAVDADVHSYGKWTLTKNPTATEQGTAVRVCGANGDHTETKTDVPVLTDTSVWTLDTEKSQAPTHTADGINVYTSAEYGEVTVPVSKSEDAHVYGGWTFVGGQPTLTAGGKIQRTCSDAACGHVEEEDVPALSDTSFWTKTETEPATHQTAGIADFANAEYGIKVEGVTVPKLAHTFGAWEITQEPTATSKGTATRTCTLKDCAEDETAVETKELPELTDAFWTKSHTAANYNSGSTDTYTNSEYGLEIKKVADDKKPAPYDNGEYYCFEYKVDDKGKLSSFAVDHVFGGYIFKLDGNVGDGTMHPVNGKIVINSKDPDVLNGEIDFIIDGEVYPAYYDAETKIIVLIYSSTDIKIFTPYYDTREVHKDILDENDKVIDTITFDANFVKRDGKAATITVGNDTVFAIDYNYADGKNIGIYVREGAVRFNVNFTDLDGTASDLSAMDGYTNLLVKDADGGKVENFGYNPLTERWQVCDGFEGEYEVKYCDVNKIVVNGAGAIDCTFCNGDGKSSTYKYEGVDGFGRENISTVIGKDYFVFAFDNDGKVTGMKKNVSIVFNFNSEEVLNTDEFGTVNEDGNYELSVSKTVPFKLPVPLNNEKMFIGWYLDKDCKTPVELDKDGNYVPVHIYSIDFYAKWSVKITLTVEGALDGDNGTFYVGASEVLGDYLPDYVSGKTIDRVNGKKFVGWFYGDIPVTEDTVLDETFTELTITAHWEDCLAYEGTYNGVYVYGSAGNSSLSVSPAKELTIIENGKITVGENEVVGKFVFMNGDNTFWIKANETATTQNYYGVYDPLGGVIAISSTSDSTILHSGSRTYVMLVDKKSVTLVQESTCQFDGVKARLMTFVADGEEITVFMYDGAIYGDVTFTSEDGAVTIADAHTKNQLSVYDKNHNLVAYFMKDGDKGLVLSDGYQGTYTNEGKTVVVNGIGGITVDGAEGVYEVVDTNVLGVYLNDRTEYIEVTLNGDTYTSKKPMVKVTFVDTDGNGAKTVDVNKNIVYALHTPTHNNSAVYIFIGWYFDEQCTDAVTSDWVPTENDTLYAKYGEKKSLTIHGLVYGSTDEVKYFYSDGKFYDENGTEVTIEVNEPDDKLHIFKGWFTDEACTEGNEYDITSAVTEDSVIYAKWVEAPAYYKTYKSYYHNSTSNGATCSSGGNVAFNTDGVTSSKSDYYPFSSGNSNENPMVIHGYNKDSNEIIVEWFMNDNSTNHYFSKGVIDHNTGIILFGWVENNTLEIAEQKNLDLSKFLLLVPDGTTAKASTWGGKGLARAFTVTLNDSSKFNIFANGDKAYFNVIFKTSESATDTVAAENCYKQEELYVYDSENNLISKSIKISGSLMPLDGRQGDYAVTKVGEEELGFTTLNLNGAGSVTVDGTVGTYTVEGEVIKLKFSDAYYEITVIDVDAKTCSVKRPMSTVKFDTAYGTVADVRVNTNTAATITVPENTATHDFDGWYANADFSGTKYTTAFMPTAEGEVILHAKWLEKSVVTFNYGKTGIDNVTYSSKYVGEKIGSSNLAPALYQDGKIVKGWFTKDGTDGDWGEEVTGDTLISSATMTVYAKWEESEPYLVTTSGSYKWTETDGVWTSGNYDEDSTSSTMEIKILANAIVTLKAGASCEFSSDKLTIYVNGTKYGSDIGGKTETVEFKEFTFDLNAGDTVKFTYSKDRSAKSNLDIAQVKDIVATPKVYVPVTLTYNYNGQGTANHVENMTSYDKVETLLEVTDKFGGKVFAGWFTKDGTDGDWGEEFVAGTVITEDTVVYAKWQEVGSYNVTFGTDYQFVYDSNGFWKSNNQGVGNSKSIMKIAANGDGLVIVEVTYWLSSEAKYDYLTSSATNGVTGTAINTKGSNYTQEQAKTSTFTLTDTGELTLQYQKDGSGNIGDDTAYLIIKINGEEYVFNDGTKGTFNGSLNGLNATVVSTGTGKLSVDGVEVDYVLNEGKLNFILNNSMKVITVADGAFTQVQDGYAGEYTMPDGSKINLDGLGGVTDTNKTYVVNGKQITIYDGAESTTYGLDVANKTLSGKSLFAGLKFVHASSSKDYIEFNDDIDISGKMSFTASGSHPSSYDGAIEFTGVLEGNTLTITVTKQTDGSPISVGKTLTFTVSNGTLTVKSASNMNSYWEISNGWTYTCADFSFAG